MTEFLVYPAISNDCVLQNYYLRQDPAKPDKADDLKSKRTFNSTSDKLKF
jgi:hypothetical protein